MPPNNPRADRIPGRRAYGGLLLVPVLCNESERLYFLVDTGASLTAITDRTAKRLTIDLGRPLRTQTIACPGLRMLSVPVVRIRSLRIGTLDITDLEVPVIAFPQGLRLDGLLGVNVLQRFRPTLEFDTGTLVLRARSAS